MAIIRAKNESDYTFKIDGLSGDLLNVVRFSGTEAISELFHFSLDLASLNSGIDFEKTVGQAGLLTIHEQKGKRYVHGLINQFEQIGNEGKWTHYRARLVPQTWLLSCRSTCRIFQEQNIPDIIKKVLIDGGISSDQIRFSLKKSYSPREYCVQYRESDLVFISRLMEQYGLFYFFEHAASKHVMVIGDDPVVHVSIADTAEVIYHPPGTTGVSDREHISEYSYHREIRSGAARLRDFDFKKPKLNLEQQAKAQGDGTLEVYDYPGEYVTPSDGAEIAKVRLEELQALKQIGSGHSDCRRFLPGYWFTLGRHDRADFNRKYLLIRVTHSGGQPQVLGAESRGKGAEGPVYENQFECIPSDVPFRPLRLTPQPFIPGVQTAVVVGPKGEEIYTDEHGRIKVQFHWDRAGKQDEKSSCWIRVAQTTAGRGYGSLFIPRIGHEVIVEFLEGDPDRPIVMGSVYNAENVPPCALPGQKIMTAIKSNSSPGGGGSNEIRLDDSKGQEGMTIHAQYDCTENVGHDRGTTIGNNETLKVAVDRSATIGSNETISVGADQTVSIKANQSVTIGANETVKVGGNRTETITGNASQTVSASKTETIAVAKALSIGAGYQVSIGAGMNETVGAAKAEEIGGALMVNVGGISGENVGANKSVKAGGNISHHAGGKFTLDAGGNFSASTKAKGTIDAADELILKCGSASIILKSGGEILIKGTDITIKGDKITVKGSGDVVIKGSKIGEN